MKKLFILLTVLLAITGARAQHGWNTAATFSGGEYLAAENTDLNSTDDVFTVEFWINPDQENSAYSIVGKSQFRIMTNHDGTLRIQTGGNTKGSSNAALPKDQWTHVAVVFNTTADHIRIYLNGTLDNTLSYSGGYSATSDSLIVGDSPYASAFSGQLDELRIWSTARTSAEIRNNMRTHIGWRIFPYYHSDLILVQTYEFDVYSFGGVYLPYLVEVGDVKGTHIGTDPSTSVKHNTGVYFDGASYLEASAADDPDVSLEGPVTVEAWVRPATIGTEQVILDLTDGAGGYELSIDADGKVQWIMNHVGRSSSVLEPDKWYHIAVACETPSNGSQICRIYINGEENGAGGYGALQRNTGKLRVGASVSGTNHFTGYMDEVRISNFTKSAQQIKEGLYRPVNYRNKPEAPEITVAYNFDGIIYSGTRDGPALVNNGARFSYASEPAAPLFFLGYQHAEKMDSVTLSSPAKEIPNVGTAGYTYDTIEINDNVSIEDIKVFLALSHEQMNTLRVELISPEGSVVKLIDQESATNYMQTITTLFDDNAVFSVINNDLIDYSPHIQGTGSFSAFSGENSYGDWVLKITDLANGNTGALHSWGLQVSGQQVVTGFNTFPDEASVQGMVYPNPGNALFCFNTGEDRPDGTLTVYNLNGQPVRELPVKKQKIFVDLSGQTEGTYIFKYVSGSTALQRKVVLSR